MLVLDRRLINLLIQLQMQECRILADILHVALRSLGTAVVFHLPSRMKVGGVVESPFLYGFNLGIDFIAVCAPHTWIGSEG